MTAAPRARMRVRMADVHACDALVFVPVTTNLPPCLRAQMRLMALGERRL